MLSQAPRIPRLTPQQLTNFWRHVDKDATSGCWNWTACKNASGYGIFTIRPTAERYPAYAFRAHRLSYSLHYDDPGNLCVCHRCDNRICVNPAHLFLGTRADNYRDQATKGRASILPVTTKLSEENIREIRSLFGLFDVRELANKYGVKAQAIYRILRHQTWKDSS